MKKSVIVGIPAYNEEKSIKNILESLINQKVNTFLLQKIVVYSDACSDNTNTIVKKIKIPLINIIESKQRSGKTHAIKELLKYASHKKADFLIIIDSDLLITDNYLLEKLLEKIISESTVAAVSGTAIPVKPQLLIEKVNNFGFELWQKIIESSKEKELYFKSSDPLIVLRINSFIEERIKDFNYMHDEFYYLFCRKYGHSFIFEPNAIVYYRLPKTLKDYQNQMTRYLSTHMSDHERKLLNDNSYKFSIKEKLLKFIVHLRTNFFIGSVYLILQTYMHILTTMNSKNFKNTWGHISSTK